MPRRPRVHYVGAVYHVMMQGNYKQRIFYDEQDFKKFYFILEKAVKQYACYVHLFCLMSNHVHIMIEVKHVPLMKIMQSIGAAYANYLNRKMDRNGHLFRGRYHEKIVEDLQYMRELCYYIHMNPLKAGVVSDLDHYQWSSHHVYMRSERLEWVSQEKILSVIGEAYSYFMENYRHEYGEAKFCHFQDDGGLIVAPFAQKTIKQVDGVDLSALSLQEISSLICDRCGVAVHLLSSGVKKDVITIVRTLVAYFAHYHGRYTLLQIATYLGSRAETLGKTMARQFASAKKRKIIDLKIKYLTREFFNLILEKKRIGKSDLPICEN